jgi:hypothetical protein
MKKVLEKEEHGRMMEMKNIFCPIVRMTGRKAAKKGTSYIFLHIK